MPIYEFACTGCRKKVSVFQRSMTTAVGARCPECGGTELTRLISTFSFKRSMPDFDDMSGMDDMMEGLDEDDPASVARWARRMGDAMGEDLPPDFDEQVRRMEAGEMPEDDGLGGGDDFDDFED